MTTFALIPGAHHGAWCWDRLVPELRARGHHAIAIDPPYDDPSAGVSRCADAAIEALRDVKDDIFLVGHSLGGVIVPVVAARRPIKRMVFLAAPLPEPGRALVDQQAADPGMMSPSAAIDNGDGTRTRTPEEAAARYYHDCDEESRAWAISRLRRQSLAVGREPSPLTSWPNVPSSYIVCADDRAIRPDWCRATARRVLGVEPIEIPGSHSPMLARPADLAEILTGLA